MPTQQLNNHKNITELKEPAAFDAYLTFCALGGLTTNETGDVKQMKLYEFLKKYNISNTTTWRWKRRPDFGLLVRQRREEIFPVAREAALFNRLFLIATGSKDHKAAVDAIKTALGHFSDLKLPTQKVEAEIKFNAADMLIKAKADGIIEAEVISGPNDNTSSNGEDQGALQATS